MSPSCIVRAAVLSRNVPAYVPRVSYITRVPYASTAFDLQYIRLLELRLEVIVGNVEMELIEEEA